MFKITGLDEFKKKLEDIADNAKALHGKHEIPMNELFNGPFLSSHTRFSSFEEFRSATAAAGFNISSTEEFEKIPDDAWDAFIVAQTSFPNWKEMFDCAGAVWAKKKLGL